MAIYSMATSSADLAPRGLEFLYDPHRLNVATSRARAIAIIVASPDLCPGLLPDAPPDALCLRPLPCLGIKPVTPPADPADRPRQVRRTDDHTTVFFAQQAISEAAEPRRRASHHALRAGPMR